MVINTGLKMVTAVVSDTDNTVEVVNSPPSVSNDRPIHDRVPSNSVQFGSSPSSTSKRPFEAYCEGGNRIMKLETSFVGNVSVVSSSDSIGNSSDDESATASTYKTPITNKKPKISSSSSIIISDDSSDDDDAVPAVVVSTEKSANRLTLPGQITQVQASASRNGSNTPDPMDTVHNSSHYQKKYEPPTSKNMSKVELSLWRKQQRQQRNRMSAAASRQKQKARITELEQQIAEYRQKYAAIQLEIERMEKIPCDNRRMDTVARISGEVAKNIQATQVVANVLVIVT